MKLLCWAPHPINNQGINYLNRNGLEVITSSLMPDTNIKHNVVAAIYRSGVFSRTMMEQLPKLRVIAVHGVGYDGIDIHAATAKGIVVLNTPNMNSRSVAEHALSMMFGLAKRLAICDREIRAGNYQKVKYADRNREMFGVTLGIVGFGAIGQHLAQMSAMLSLKVIVHSNQSSNVIEQAGYQKADSLEMLLSRSDFVSLHAPATHKTRHMISYPQLALMKSDAYLINTSRGSLIDEAALIEALQNGVIAGAALDVFEQEPLPVNSALLAAPNLLITPHTAASTEAAMINMAMAAAQGVVEVLNNETPRSLLNAEVWPNRRMT